ncbi:hypothetical protein GCM10009838_49040 [Catenulispora subtropica]|uniref:MFS transporter n=1 Tax=Catenulispora subtropica TaxID=450798 RepID=A0ABN2S7Y0_9ACTN
MTSTNRPDVDPYRLYLSLQAGMAFLNALAFTTAVVYWVQGAGLSPLLVGMVGSVASIRIALLTGAAALVPASGILMRLRSRAR